MTAQHSAALPLANCAWNNTVIGTVVSAAYIPPLLRFANRTSSLGFRCIIVQPMDELPALQGNARLRVLQLPPTPLLPEPQWCAKQGLMGSYGWRRSQFYKVCYVFLYYAWCTLLLTDLGTVSADAAVAHHTQRRSRHARIRP